MMQEAAFEQHLRRSDFLQMVRTLLLPKQPGEAPLDIDQAVRFRAELGAQFPGRNATWIERQRDPAALDPWKEAPQDDEQFLPVQHRRMLVTTPDFCVGSVLGPLPEPFLEWMRDLERAGQPGMRNFLDLFNHRINALRYRVRAEFEPGLNNLPPEQTLQAQWLAALMGVGSDDAASQIPLRERNWLGIGELLANNRRSAAGVEQVLTAHLRCRVRLTPLVPKWRMLGKYNEQQLGQRRLGVDALIGRSTWDIQAAVRLDAGPLDYAAMVALLPPLTRRRSDPGATARELQRQWRERQEAAASGNAAARVGGWDALVALVRLMLDHRHDAHFHIQVPERGIPPSVLTAHPPAGQAGLRLGQTAWLKSRSRAGHTHRGPAARQRTVRLHIQAYAGDNQ